MPESDSRGIVDRGRFEEHFRELYFDRNLGPVINRVDRSVRVESRNAPFDPNIVRLALETKKHKSPGPDGFGCSFFFNFCNMLMFFAFFLPHI